LQSLNGNVNIINSVDDDASPNRNLRYKSSLQFESITSEYVGKYFCIYNSSLKETYDYEYEVEKYKASTIYIFVDGEIRLFGHYKAASFTLYSS
jgi:hypothetical protein